MGEGLLINFALALGAAFLGAMLAVRLGQSAIIGYILAGVAIGPWTPGFMADTATVEALANVGVVLLLFTIGVQLNFRDLVRSGPVAIVGGSAQVLFTVALGYAVGVALGWDWLESLFFGAVLSNSSSTVLGKILGERGEAGSEHGQIGLAWSTVQDLSTIALVVVLSSLASGGEFVIPDLLRAVGSAVLFLVLLIPVGLKVFPLLFERVAALRSRELFVMAVAAVALGTAYGSTYFGLSLALGAFVAGVVVGESELSYQILGEVTPIRDILAGLFFVSVGMFVDPLFVLNNLPLVLLVMGLIVVVKGALVAGITLLFRYSLPTALLTGVTLAQSAEFSFILARVGADLGVVSGTVFNLLLAGAVASILVSPLLHQVVGPSVRWLEQRLPESDLARVPAAPPVGREGRRHAVICGFGQVGSVVGEALARQGFSYVVIEHDPRIVRALRDRGIVALLGSVDNPVLLERAQLERARLLVLAIPDAVAVRQIVEFVRRHYPRLDIVARTHSAEEVRYLRSRGVGEAVLGELETALEISRHTLRKFGVTVAETTAIIQGLRDRASQASGPHPSKLDDGTNRPRSAGL